MGYGVGCMCYYNSYNESGEIAPRQLMDSLILLRNRTRNNTDNLLVNSVANESYIFNLQLSSLNYDLVYSSNLNNDISYQLDSRILKNVDKLSPEKRRCIICLENFVNSDKIVNLSCLHMFHDECIRKWLNENNFCPICKNEI